MTQDQDELQEAAEFLAEQAEQFCSRVDSTASEPTMFAMFDRELDFDGLPNGERPLPYHPAIVWAMLKLDIEELVESAEIGYPDVFFLDEIERAAVLISLGVADHVARELLEPDPAHVWTEDLVAALCQSSTPGFPFRVDLDEDRVRRVLGRIRDRNPMRNSGAMMASCLDEFSLDAWADALRERLADDGMPGWLTGVGAIFATSICANHRDLWFQMASCAVLLARRTDRNVRTAIQPTYG